MKAFGLTLLSFFIISIFISLNNPPGVSTSDQEKIMMGFRGFNPDYPEPYRFDPNNHPEMLEILNRLPKTNFDREFDVIPNFFAHYSNTILTWFGKPRYLYNHYPKFWIDNPEKISHYLIKSGSIMPYIIVFSLIFGFIFYLFRLDK